MALTEKELQDFYEREQERLDLGRKVRAIEALQKPVAKRIVEHVEAKGGSDRTTVCHGFRLSLHTVTGQVSWKDAFVRVAGVDAALAEERPERDQLVVEKAA